MDAPQTFRVIVYALYTSGAMEDYKLSPPFNHFSSSVDTVACSYPSNLLTQYAKMPSITARYIVPSSSTWNPYRYSRLRAYREQVRRASETWKRGDVVVVTVDRPTIM
jgi:hypothetical protein